MQELKTKIVTFFTNLNYSKIGKIIEMTIIFVVLLLIMIRIFVKDPEYYRDSKKEQQTIQSKIDSVYKKQDSIDIRIADLERGQIIFYDIVKQSVDGIEANNRELTKLRKAYNEKIHNTNNYSIADIDSFFRARYPHLYKE